jgi:hypothetical protein
MMNNSKKIKVALVYVHILFDLSSLQAPAVPGTFLEHSNPL